LNPACLLGASSFDDPAAEKSGHIDRARRLWDRVFVAQLFDDVPIRQDQRDHRIRRNRGPIEHPAEDRQMVHAEHDEAVRCAAIVSSVPTLGQCLDIATTAEGVETEEQFASLLASGVTVVQGHLFGRPRPVSELDFGKVQLRRLAVDAA
jgi:EAL domain